MHVTFWNLISLFTSWNYYVYNTIHTTLLHMFIFYVLYIIGIQTLFFKLNNIVMIIK